VVLRPHRPWWNQPVSALPSRNLAEQPFDRGSAPGVLLAALRIYRRDPQARVILLSEGCEQISARRIAEAFDRMDGGDDVIMVARVESSRRRRTFIRRASMARRPGHGEWRIMMETGQARTGGVIVSTAHALRQLFIDTQPELEGQFATELKGASLFDGLALDQLYPFLPNLDFEADVLARASGALTALVDEKPRIVDAPARAVSV